MAVAFIRIIGVVTVMTYSYYVIMAVTFIRIIGVITAMTYSYYSYYGRYIHKDY